MTALSDYVTSLNLSDEVIHMIELARHDLFYGPLYFDADNEECSCFDEGATAFNFSAACAKISDALDFVGDLWVDTDSGDWQITEPQWCWKDQDGELCMEYPELWGHYDRHEVLTHIVGKELVTYI